KRSIGSVTVSYRRIRLLASVSVPPAAIKLLRRRPKVCHLFCAYALTADGEHTGLLPAGQGDPDRVASGGREDGARGPYADRSRSGGWCELAQRWSLGCRRCAIRRKDAGQRPAGPAAGRTKSAVAGTGNPHQAADQRDLPGSSGSAVRAM